MAVSQWPDKFSVMVLESTGVQAVCAFTLPEATQLKYIPLWLRKVGTEGGSERFRLKVFGNVDLTAPLATSAWVTLAGLEAMATQWLGFARFEFNRENLQASRRYYLGIEPDNYTRNGTTYYVSIKLDDKPSNIPVGGVPPELSIMGYK